MSSLDDDDDEAFVRYCQIHSETERHLFSGHHINRLFRLAGQPKVPCNPNEIAGMDRWLVTDLVKDIEALRPPCLPANAATNGKCGTSLQAERQAQIRTKFGWSYDEQPTQLGA